MMTTEEINRNEKTITEPGTSGTARAKSRTNLKVGISTASRLGLLMIAAVLISASPCLAQTSTFSFGVTVNGIPSCTFQGFSYSFAITETTANDWVPKTSFSNFSITRNSDNCSPALYSHVAYGTPLPSVVISVQANVNGAIREMKRITLTGVVVSSVIGTSANHETVGFSFTTMTVRWPDGTESTTSKQ